MQMPGGVPGGGGMVRVGIERDITRILYGNITVFCLWKVIQAKNFAALLHKLGMRCLVNLYDVQKGMLFETTFFYSIYLWKHSQPCILVYFLHFVQTK